MNTGSFLQSGIKQLIFPVIFYLIFIPSCTLNKQSVYKKSRALMDTFVTITVVSDSEAHAESAIDQAFTSIQHFSDMIDFFSEKSELSQINRNAGIKAVTVSPDTLAVINIALQVAEKSGGAFDPTMGPVVKLWDFYAKAKPSDERIMEKLPLVDYRDVLVDNKKSTVFLKISGMSLDLGGIAKGYAADLASDSLAKSGIRAGLIAAAGDIRSFGVKPDGKPWLIGIQNPRQKNSADEIIGTIKLGNEAVSTSGDYQRYFILDGQRYHHLLDPGTGYPSYRCRSVSIIADKGVLADAFSTAIFILGPEKGLELARDEGIHAIIVDNEGTVLITAGLKGKVDFEKRN